MKNIILAAFSLLVSCHTVKSQDYDNDLDKVINNLSWNSFEILTNYATQIELDDSSKRLISEGKKVTEKLIRLMDDDNKTVAIHLILTKIWDPIVFEIKMQDEIKLDNDYYIKYLLNNLSWLKKDKSEINLLDKSEKGNIIKFWKNRTKYNGPD